MARLPRFVMPDQPQHVIVRGNNRSELLSPHLEYLRMGKTDEARQAALHAVAIGSYPLTPKFDLTAKLGMSQNTTTGKATGGVMISGANPFSANSLMYGVGVQYHVTSKVSIRGQYEDYGAINSTSPTANMTAFSAGVVYNF